MQLDSALMWYSAKIYHEFSSVSYTNVRLEVEIVLLGRTAAKEMIDYLVYQLVIIHTNDFIVSDLLNMKFLLDMITFL